MNFWRILIVVGLFAAAGVLFLISLPSFQNPRLEHSVIDVPSFQESEGPATSLPQTIRNEDKQELPDKIETEEPQAEPQKQENQPINEPAAVVLNQEVETPAANLEPKFVLNEEKIMEAVVRIRCGSTFGSGFILKNGEKRFALTAAHVVIDRIQAKNFNCDVIFPKKDDNGNFRETYYRIGKILSPEEVKKQYMEEGIDFAVLEVLPLEDKSEDAERFPNGYPFVDFGFCPSGVTGDSIILWGYSANLGTSITPGAFLSRFTGEIVQYADVNGVIQKPSSEFAGGFVYLPDFTSSLDSTVQHHLIVIVSNNNFSGASGGLAFNTSKNCIVGTNIATLVKNNLIFGFVTNPNFPIINNWLKSLLEN